ncbi:sporulation YhaL family protein [Evansella sp. AB-P1]|uniref:sporulation YhaL family protein n=1 Tax=Evansella sp. AB-P1 TaxID=3037653 RepID=UPI00241EF070|nr:sporulation YhaL family protein [Evansella sp. AB-P1]MDG5786400.1 sporulation YhaL family protein [Evansella sp. AB-P1]
MNPITIIFSILGILFLTFVVRLLTLTNAGPAVVSAPWWVYVIYLAIIFSGIMFVYTVIDERRKEQRIIETEGREILIRYNNSREKLKETDRTTLTGDSTEDLDNELKRYMV